MMNYNSSKINFWIPSPQENNIHIQNYAGFGPKPNNFQNLCLLKDVNKILHKFPRKFTITTNNGSGTFNTDLLIETSSTIANYIREIPQDLIYHLDIDDTRNVLGKFELLYQGEKVVFENDDLPICKQITEQLYIPNCLNYMKPDNMQNNVNLHYYHMNNNGSELDLGVQINGVSQYFQLTANQPFIISTKKKEYKCNIYGIMLSNFLYELVQKDPKIKSYKYDFEDEYNEFQLICDLFNFQTVEIKRDNIDSIKEIAEDLQIECIYENIEEFINTSEEVSQKIDDQQKNIDLIDELFELLFNIKEKTVQTVKQKIMQSSWIETEENVQEFVAFLIEASCVDIKLHPYLADLVIELKELESKSNSLHILQPFLNKKMMNFLNQNNQNYNFSYAFIYTLYKKGFLPKEELFDSLKNVYISNSNLIIYLLPVLAQIDRSKVDSIIHFYKKQRNHKDDPNYLFLKSYLPNKIDQYEKMLDSYEPDDKITKALRNDDVDSFQSIVASVSIDLSKGTIPYNIFDDFILRNNKVSYIEYAAMFGSIKCFKYLLLNHVEVNQRTFQFAIYGGNNEIIQIVDKTQANNDFSNNNININFNNHNNYNNYYNNEEHHHHHKKKDKKMKKSDHVSIQISSITSFDVYKTLPPVNIDEEDEEQKKIKAEQERKEKLRQLYPPPVYDRPPPTPVILDLISQIDDENIEDPFSSAIQALAAIIRFVSNFNDNENHILTTLQNDSNAYDAFLKATCSDDESALQYLSQVKEDESCLAKNVLQIEQLNQLQMKLLKILKMSKKRANGMAQEIQECRTAAAANELNSQQSILKEVQNDFDPKKSTLLILQKLQQSLAVIDNLCLALTSEEQAKHAVLTKRVKDFMAQVEQQKQIVPGSIETLIENVQTFISSIKPSSAKTLKEIISSATKAEFDELNKKIKSYKDSVKKYKKKFTQEQQNSETLELQIKTLRSRLNDEKELNQNAISLYQSQIAMLKSLFNTLNLDASKDPLGMAEAVRNEVLSLQHLLGTSTSERDVLKSKVADLEDILSDKEKHISHLLIQIEDINQKNIELEAAIVEYKKEMMFHSSDIEQLRKEKEADIAIGTKHLMQLQEVMQKNQEVVDQSHEIEKKMNEMKDEVRKLKEENENLEIQIALTRFSNTRSAKTSIGTQTILRLVNKKQEYERSQSRFQRLSPFQSPQQNQSNQSSPFHQTNLSQFNSDSQSDANGNENNRIENDDDLPQHEKVVPDSVPPIQGVPQSSLNQGKEDTEHQNTANSNANNNNRNEQQINGENNEHDGQIEEEEFNEVATDFDWEVADFDQTDDEADTFAAEFPQIGKDDLNQHQRFSPDEKAPEKVHRPLHLKKYKKILSKINKRPTTATSTTNTTPKSAKQRPVTPAGQKSNLPQTPHSAVSKTGRPQTAAVRPKTPNPNGHQQQNQQQNQEENALAIGHSVQGHRALAGQLGKIKPTVTGRAALAMKTAFCQHPGRVLPIESARNYKFNNNNNNNVAPKPKKTFQNGDQPQPTFPTAPNFITEYNNAEPPETIRITRIEYAHSNNEQEQNSSSRYHHQIEDDGPIILPIERFSVCCDPTSVSGPIAKSARPFDLAEFERLTAKLQARIQEFLVSLNKKDEIINDMKKKYAELFGERQKCEIKLVRLMDSVKRTEIRCENAQTRLDIVMRELNLRDEDNKELKKEIIRLKTLSGPATTTLAAVKESHMKQMQLKREKQKKKMVLIAAMSAIGSTTDKDVQKHLGKILENTQKSIARLEIQRRKYKEEERKQVYAALSAISLINDRKDENDSFHRFALLNYADNDDFDNQSKWNQNKSAVQRNAWNYKANSFNHNNAEPVVFKNYENADLNRKFPSYNHAMEMIDRIQPPLSAEERRIILRGEMTEEIAAKIAEFDKVDNIMPVLSGTKIDV